MGCKLYTPEMFGAKGDGINSYIVGCKLSSSGLSAGISEELIVT